MDKKKIEQGKKMIENARSAIRLNKNTKNRVEIIDKAMRELYNFFSSWSEEEFNDSNYWFLEIDNLEEELSTEYLNVNYLPEYSEEFHKNLPSKIVTEEDCETILDYVVHVTRKEYISKELNENLTNSSLRGRCLVTSSYVTRKLEELGITSFRIDAAQDFTPQTYHCFVIAEIPLENGTTKKYLIDCTYRQFFTKREGYIERIGLPNSTISGCSIGTYMTMTNERRKKAEQILSKGYIEATEENLKDYFDAIIFSGRGKDYYEKNNLDYRKPDDCIPKYSIKWYMYMISKYQQIPKTFMKRIAVEIINSKFITLSEFHQIIATIIEKRKQRRAVKKMIMKDL